MAGILGNLFCKPVNDGAPFFSRWIVEAIELNHKILFPFMAHQTLSIPFRVHVDMMAKSLTNHIVPNSLWKGFRLPSGLCRSPVR